MIPYSMKCLIKKYFVCRGFKDHTGCSVFAIVIGGMEIVLSTIISLAWEAI